MFNLLSLTFSPVVMDSHFHKKCESITTGENVRFSKLKHAYYNVNPFPLGKM
jgi:hypothetical protein